MMGLELYNALVEALEEEGGSADQFRDLDLEYRHAWDRLAIRLEWKERQ